jgi:hypothetical protein
MLCVLKQREDREHGETVGSDAAGVHRARTESIGEQAGNRQ